MLKTINRLYKIFSKKWHKKTPFRRVSKKPYKIEITLDRMHLSPASSQGLFLWTLKIRHVSTSLSYDTEAFVSPSISSEIAFCALLLTAFYETFPAEGHSIPFRKPFFTSFLGLFSTWESSFLWLKYTTLSAGFQSAIPYENGAGSLCKRYIIAQKCWKLLTYIT